MAVVVADLQALPQFAARTSGEIQFWIDRAPRHVDTSLFAVDGDVALLYWIAHALTVAGRRGAAGQVSAEAAGPVSVQYATGQLQGALADWTRSSWGGMLAQLARNIDADACA